MSTTPTVTIGLPVFNGERYLAETLDSLLAQDLTDLELIVADNGSTDATPRICADYARRDPRVRVHRSEINHGAAWNYNRIVGLARGRYFKWAGYDDLLDPDVLSSCVAVLERETSAALAFPRTVIIDADGRKVRRYDDRLALDHGAPYRRVAAFANRVGLCNPCFGVMRTDVLRRTGLIRTYISSDVTLLAEMASYGAFVAVPGTNFYRRVHDGSSRQGKTTLAQVARWFDTGRTSAPRAPRVRLLAGTVAALASSQLPLGTRAAAAGAFGTVYAVRRARITAGSWRERVRGGPRHRPELIYAVEAASR